MKAGPGHHGHCRRDIHDISKGLMVTMLDVNGFEVFDLALMFVQTIVDKIKTNAPVVGLSGFNPGL